MRQDSIGMLLALGAAACFGLVNVAARGSPFHPILLAGVTYVLAGLALSPALRRSAPPLRDLALLVAMSLVGGALAPALLFFGLRHASASDASLLLTLEMVFTAILAAVFLGERTRGRGILGLALLFAASLAVASGATRGGNTTLAGALLVAAAALGWGVDNTLSARLVGSYPPTYVLAVKGIVGGGSALLVAIALGAPLPVHAAAWARAAFIGLVGVAASVLLFYFALQRIGAIRTSALFLPGAAIAGVLGAALLLGEPLLARHGVALGLVVAGAAFLRPR